MALHRMVSHNEIGAWSAFCFRSKPSKFLLSATARQEAQFADQRLTPMNSRQEVKHSGSNQSRCGRSGAPEGTGDGSEHLPALPGTWGAAVFRWLAPLLIAAVAGWTLSWSWAYGPDVLIDFGRELYVPWRIVAGDTLYVDLMYLNGPLSPYWNALLFQLFGVGLRTLMIANAVLSGLLTATLYAIFTLTANRLAATVACLAFVSFLAFTQLGDIGSFNYLTPYSHEITHGVFLALLALLVFAQRQRFGNRAVAVSGFLLGLVFLTKVEVFLAASAGLLTALLGSLWVEHQSRRESVVLVVTFAVANLVSVLFVFLLMLVEIPPAIGFHALVNPLLTLFNSSVTESPFYQWVRGTDQLLDNLTRMGVWVMRYAIAALPLVVLGLAVRTRAWWRWLVPVGVFVVVYTSTGPGPYLSFLGHGILPSPPTVRVYDWPHAVRALPVVLPLLGFGVFLALVRARRAGRRTDVLVLRLAIIVFAFTLLAKIFFNVRLYHYGFALAMPGTMVLIAAVLAWIPAWIERHGGSGAVFAAGALGVLLVAGQDLVALVGWRYQSRTHSVGRGVDAFQDGSKAVCVAAVLADLSKRMTPDETLAVVPEGVMLNYLARRRASTPHINFMPIELILYDEDRMIADFQRNPPDFIAVAHKHTVEYGLPLFGMDYGVALFNWVKANYTLLGRCGEAPLREPSEFGIDILEHRNRKQRTLNR